MGTRRVTPCLLLLVAAAAINEQQESCDADGGSACADVSLLQHETWIVSADAHLTVDRQATSSGMAREHARTKLRIEQDLNELSDKHYRAWDLAKDCKANADDAFDQFLETSDLMNEMSESEITCFRGFFDEHVVYRCKHDGDSMDWHAVIREAFEEEKPMITAQQAASMNQAHGGHFTVSVTATCVSKREMKAKLGRDNSDAAMNAALLEVERTRVRRSESELDASQLPAAFDSAEHWPDCASVIRRIHNQGTCGSCWAFAGASVMDSLICIKTGGAFQEQLSRTVLTSCAHSGDGCQGGWEYYVFAHIKNNGVPTGGNFGCVPYFAHGDGQNHFTETQGAPPCASQCVPNYTIRPFADDSFVTPGAKDHELVWRPDDRSWTANLITTLKQGLMLTGPVAYGIFANSAFMGYASGVFDASCENTANHAVVTIGWAHTSGTDAWLSLNSWGSGWGENGAFRVVSCVITDYTIPGDLDASDIAGFPMNADPTPPPAPTPATPSTITVEGSGCAADTDGCVSTRNFPDNYDDEASCTILHFPTRINVIGFNTESGYDKLTVNGQDYSGTSGPHHVEPTGPIEWSSDGSVVDGGWKICPDSPSPPEPFPASTTGSPFPPSSTASSSTSSPEPSPASTTNSPLPPSSTAAPEPLNGEQDVGDFVDSTGVTHHITVRSE